MALSELQRARLLLSDFDGNVSALTKKLGITRQAYYYYKNGDRNIEDASYNVVHRMAMEHATWVNEQITGQPEFLSFLQTLNAYLKDMVQEQNDLANSPEAATDDMAIAAMLGALNKYVANDQQLQMDLFSAYARALADDN